MSLPDLLTKNLTLPVIGAPLFIVSNPDLVIAQCVNGVVGSFPALNARPQDVLEEWLRRITDALSAAKEAEPERRIAPYAVNQIIHTSNVRLDHDMEVCAKFRVPIIITSLSAPSKIVPIVHDWGGLVFHDVISVRHAKKAIEAGVDGLILVCAGAGGHAGTQSPFALVQEVRRFWNGPIALSGAIATGRAVLAAQAIGADLAYVGTRFIASHEANADERHKQMIVDSDASEIVYTPFFTGVAGNYLARSVTAAGFDTANIPHRDKETMSFGAGGSKAKAWRDVWGAGQGVGTISDVASAGEIISRMKREYDAARRELVAEPFVG